MSTLDTSISSGDRWTDNYLRLAKQIASWSKDPSTQCGAVAVGKHGQILSQGYNGFARGVKDYNERLYNREQKYKYTIHAEMNCIFNSSLTGISLEGADLYVYGLPVCDNCAKGVVQVGFKRVFMCYPAAVENRREWVQAFKTSREMFVEAGVLAICFHEETMKQVDSTWMDINKHIVGNAIYQTWNGTQ
jgi:dCMP deaminase